MTTPELRRRLSYLRSTLLRLDHSLKLAVGEARDLVERGALPGRPPGDRVGRSIPDAVARSRGELMDAIEKLTEEVGE